MKLGDLIKQFREGNNISQRQFAISCGFSNGYISMLESGKNPKTGEPITPSISSLKIIAEQMHISLDELLSTADDMKINIFDRFPAPTIATDTVKIPIIGMVTAGYNGIAEESYTGETVEVPTSFLKGRKLDEFFCLIVKGDSMYPQFQDGDTVVVLKQTTLNRSGDIGVVLYDGDMATLKKVEYVMGEDWMKLIPLNPCYPPKTITGADLEECRILGIPKLLIRDV